MKTSPNNIEHIFKEKLQEFEATPPEHLWANISQEITPKKEQKKPFLYWYIGGIAASLLVFTTLFFNFSVTQNSETTIVATEKEDFCPDESFFNTQKNTPNTKALVDFDSTTNSNNNKATLSKGKNNIAKNPTKKSFQKEITPNTIAHQKSTPINNLASAETLKTPLIKKSEPLITENTAETILVKPIISEIEKLSKEDVLALLQPEKTKKEEKESLKDNSKKWSIQPQVTTFSYNDNGSSINSTFKNNPKNTNTDLSYGMLIAYQASSKMSIRAGINNANINISTSNIGIDNSSVSFTDDFFTNDEIAIVNLDTDNDSTTALDSDIEGDGGSVTTITSGKISQQIQYFEIPIEIAYKLLDKKIGIDIIGGFSTFILSKNDTLFESGNSSTSLGETSSINTTSFSSNFGFSFNYRLINNLKLSLEPIVKFQFNSFDDNSSNQPYFIGVSSGLKWNF